MPARCPLSGVKQKSASATLTSGFDRSGHRPDIDIRQSSAVDADFADDVEILAIGLNHKQITHGN